MGLVNVSTRTFKEYPDKSTNNTTPMNFNPEVTNYINEASPELINLLNELRELIHKCVPNTTEAIKWKFPVFGNPKDFVYLRHARKHITLGFYNIDKIDDPDSILEGGGNTLKHIKIMGPADINHELLTKWLTAICN